MKTWIIVAIIVGVLVLGSVAAYALTDSTTLPTSCGSCDGKCNAENGCQKATCTASTTGKCSCGRA